MLNKNLAMVDPGFPGEGDEWRSKVGTPTGYFGQLILRIKLK